MAPNEAPSMIIEGAQIRRPVVMFEIFSGSFNRRFSYVGWTTISFDAAEGPMASIKVTHGYQQ